MYKINKTMAGVVYGVIRIQDGWFIPPALDNTDYVNFKKDILDGAELLDADGEVMPNAIDFVNTLP
jgi:hypothetical protein